MNLETVAQLIQLMEQSSLNVLEVEDNGIRVRMESRREIFSDAHTALPNAERVYIPSITENINIVPDEVDVFVADESAQPNNHDELKSPMVGTFHELKTPVQVGTKLKAGDPICIIEAMKVMNEIVMEEDGTISWVACNEGDMVEYGQVLYTYH